MKRAQFLFIIPFLSFIIGYWIISFFVHESLIKTPALLGHSVIYALRQATQQGFTLKILDEKESAEVKPGLILAQKPVPGSIIKPKQAVFVTLSKAYDELLTPQFTGLMLPAAQDLADSDKISIKVRSVNHSAPIGMVVAQAPAPSTFVDDQTVTIFVSSGLKTERIMPDLCGLTCVVAQEFLKNYGITVSFYKEAADKKKNMSNELGIILAQRPLAGSWIDIKKPLNVQLSVRS